MHTKKEIKEIIKDDPETACCLLIDMVEMIFEADKEEREDLRDEWNSEAGLGELFNSVDLEEIEGFFEKYGAEHEYKIQK